MSYCSRWILSSLLQHLIRACLFAPAVNFQTRVQEFQFHLAGRPASLINAQKTASMLTEASPSVRPSVNEPDVALFRPARRAGASESYIAVFPASAMHPFFFLRHGFRRGEPIGSANEERACVHVPAECSSRLTSLPGSGLNSDGSWFRRSRPKQRALVNFSHSDPAPPRTDPNRPSRPSI